MSERLGFVGVGEDDMPTWEPATPDHPADDVTRGPHAGDGLVERVAERIMEHRDEHGATGYVCKPGCLSRYLAPVVAAIRDEAADQREREVVARVEAVLDAPLGRYPGWIQDEVRRALAGPADPEGPKP